MLPGFLFLVAVIAAVTNVSWALLSFRVIRLGPCAGDERNIIHTAPFDVINPKQNYFLVSSEFNATEDIVGPVEVSAAQTL